MDQKTFDKKKIKEFINKTYLFKDMDAHIIEQLAHNIELISIKKDDILFKQGDSGDAMYLIINGKLKTILQQDQNSEEILSTMEKGDAVGEIALLTGSKRTATVRAVVDTGLIKISQKVFINLIEKSQHSIQQLINIAKKRLRRDQLFEILPNFFGPLNIKAIRDIEPKIEWIDLRRGETLYKQGQIGDSFCIVISGRLIANVKDENDRERIVGEISPGECVGEMSILTGEERTATIWAMRDTQLVKFSKEIFDTITKKYPQIMRTITSIITNRLMKTLQKPSTSGKVLSIAIVSADKNISLNDFSKRLETSLKHFGSTLLLNSQRLDNYLGTEGAAQTTEDSPYDINLEAWLAEKERLYQFIIYQTDNYDSLWSNRCIRQADHIFIVANGDSIPSIYTDIKLLIAAQELQTPCSLVLCHSRTEQHLSNTREWLTIFQVKNHHHIRLEKKYFDRLARFLSGRTIGLVLGGGGARGFAHIGIIRALKEANIPIDLVGGTSMGAAISSLYAMGHEIEDMIRINKKMWIEMKPLRDFTLPIMSFIRGKKFDKMGEFAYGDLHIEDLWLNYFCISSNLTTSEMMIHRSGSLKKAARASASIPGIAFPVIDDGNLLVDGGVLNNLPGDIMQELFGGTVIVSNVSSETDLSFSSNEIPSPWKIFWSKVLPFKKPIECFNILDVLTRSTMLSSIQRAKDVQQNADLFLQPPISEYGLLQFDAIDDIAEAGYRYASKKIEAWLQEETNIRW